MKKFLKNKKILLYLILGLAFILRFYNYQNRWGLAYDQARDVIVSTYALYNHLIPLTGPFSSAGQFIYGPQWFWIISFLTAIYPNTIITPWIMQTLLYVFAVYIMFLIGKEIIGENFGLIAAFLTAISTAQVLFSTNLTSPSMVGIFSIFTVYFFIRFIKYSKNFDAFLFSFLVATTVNIHFQAVGLLFLLPVAFLLSKRKIKQLGILIIGFTIPFLPLLLFDLRTNFFETRNMLDYYLYGQQRIYVPNRWLTYAGSFWPKAWGDIIGGSIFFGYFTIFCLVILTIVNFIRKKIPKEILGIIISFLLIFIMLRYYKGQIFGGYTVFLDPFVLILTSWVLYEILRFKKSIFYLLILIISISTIYIDVREASAATNLTAKYSFEWSNLLIKKVPNKKFVIYDYNNNFDNMSRPLSLYLYNKNKLDDDGLRIGIINGTPSAIMKDQKKFPIILGELGQYQFIDLSASSDASLKKNKWFPVNPSDVYGSLEDWYKNK